jgi:HKD family nuclease
VNLQLLTPDARGAYLERVRRDIASAEHFVLVTAFATPDGLALLEPAMRTCLEAGGQGTLVLALDRQHFNAASVFARLATLVESFPNKVEVRIVREGAGLLHAKAVFAKLPDGSATLVVGSANLTERAFYQNHELGLWVNLLGNPEVSRAFQLFTQNLGGTRQDANDLRCLAGQLEILNPVVRPIGARPEPHLPAFENLIRGGAGISTSPISIETFVGDWLQAGNIVRRARRGLDVLVIRTPMDQLERNGLIERKSKKKIAAATEKTVSAGYGVRLLPDKEDDRLRKDSRGTWKILGKLTLDLPCFGKWMPKTYWDLFQQATAQLQDTGISTEAILEAAERRRRELEGEGIVVAVDAIVADLLRGGLARRGCEDDLRAALAPDIDLDLRAVARSFFVDLVQSTFAVTYRTGLWPGRFRSFVGRTIAARIAKRRLAAGEEPSVKLAFELLDGTARWGDERVSFETVTDEVKRLLGEADYFAPVTMEDLLRPDEEEGDDADDD